MSNFFILNIVLSKQNLAITWWRFCIEQYRKTGNSLCVWYNKNTKRILQVLVMTDWSVSAANKKYHKLCVLHKSNILFTVLETENPGLKFQQHLYLGTPLFMAHTQFLLSSHGSLLQLPLILLYNPLLLKILSLFVPHFYNFVWTLIPPWRSFNQTQSIWTLGFQLTNSVFLMKRAFQEFLFSP